jgi:hypothetical protein
MIEIGATLIEWCNGEYKVDARLGSMELSTFVKKKFMM